MTNEDKQLLLEDICARLPYGTIYHRNDGANIKLKEIDVNRGYLNYTDDIEKMELKPYLRPMSSMTKEEENECISFSRTIIIPHVRNWFGFSITNPIFTDWLNAHHFDYRGLIEKGLALEAPEEMYK